MSSNDLYLHTIAHMYKHYILGGFGIRFFADVYVLLTKLKDELDKAYIDSKLEKMGKLKGIVTQNIDGLHQMAGSKKVYELHGSVLRNTCTHCQTKYSLEDMMKLRDNEGIPRCSKCGAIIKPDVVLYEEGLDDYTLRKSVEYISQAEVLIIGGTSLVVYPAAGLIDYFRGEHLVVINKSPTPRDRYADLLIQEPIGQVFAQIHC